MQLDTLPVLEESDLTAAIVICTRNRPALLRRCLEGIAHLKHVPDEVIVVDNTSGDKATEAVAREFSAVYEVEPIRGLSRARNRGLAAARSDIVAYLDDDAIPDEDWLSVIRLPFLNPDVAVVTGGTFASLAASLEGRKAPMRLLNREDQHWFQIASYGGLGIGANMVLRRARCAGWKVFDERLGRGAPFEAMDEHHAIVGFIARGGSAVHIPNAVVFHSSQYPRDVKREARNSIAYWMLLFSEFPDHRLDLLQFLFRRIRRKPLTWLRDAPDPGEIITSGWRVLLAASFRASLLYFRTKKSKDK